jgi:hypothetical protein
MFVVEYRATVEGINQSYSLLKCKKAESRKEELQIQREKKRRQ